MRIMKLVVVLLLVVSLFGCAAATRMIDYGSMKTDVAMSESIFLSPTEAPRTVYVQVRNTSSSPDASGLLESTIVSGLQSKGYSIVRSPKEATYILQVNLLYLGEYKEGVNFQDTLTGGAIGALAGLGISGRGDYGKGAAIGGIGGMVAGFILDTATRVRTEIIAIDMQITERLAPGDDIAGQVVQKMETQSTMRVAGALGTQADVPTTKTVSRQVSSLKEGVKIYTAGVAARAAQVNLNVAEATDRLINIAGRQIAGIF